MSKMPTEPGFYWAKLRMVDEGSNYEDSLLPSDTWSPVEVFMNSIHENDPDHLLVDVLGLEKSQSILNFFWGEAIKAPK